MSDRGDDGDATPAWGVIPSEAPIEWSVQYHARVIIRDVPTDVDDRAVRYAYEVAQEIDRAQFEDLEPPAWIAGRGPSTLGAACVYAGYVRTVQSGSVYGPHDKFGLSQAEIAGNADCSEVSIRNCYRKVIRFHEPDATLPPEQDPDADSSERGVDSPFSPPE
jgi:hypothetical protein